MKDVSLLSLLKEEDNLLYDVQATKSCIKRAEELVAEDEMWNEVISKDKVTLSDAERKLAEVRRQIREYFREVMTDSICNSMGYTPQARESA